MDEEWLAAVKRAGWKIMKKRKKRIRLSIPHTHPALSKIRCNPEYARTKRGRELIRCRKGAKIFSSTLDYGYGAQPGDLKVLTPRN